MKKSKYTKELMAQVVHNNKSFAGVIKDLGLALSGGNYRMVQHRIRLYELDVSHFTGQKWNKGLRAEDNPAIQRCREKLRFSNKEVFTKNSPLLGGSKLRKRLLQDFKWEYKCSKCGIDSWRGSPLTLHLDHKNGVVNDNRKCNLRFLCPNCHQQTTTWGNKKCENG